MAQPGRIRLGVARRPFRHMCRLGDFSPSAAADMYTWTMPKQKRPFLVEIEAKLTVHAFDEDSARKKVKKAFAPGRPLAVDVDAGAGVWTYAVVPPEQASGS